MSGLFSRMGDRAWGRLPSPRPADLSGPTPRWREEGVAQPEMPSAASPAPEVLPRDLPHRSDPEVAIPTGAVPFPAKLDAPATEPSIGSLFPKAAFVPVAASESAPRGHEALEAVTDSVPTELPTPDAARHRSVVDQRRETVAMDSILRIRQPAARTPASPARSETRAAATAAAREEPVVHIHIGSIELRAATVAAEPKPRRREAPSPPPLSEFLRSREVRR